MKVDRFSASFLLILHVDFLGSLDRRGIFPSVAFCWEYASGGGLLCGKFRDDILATVDLPFVVHWVGGWCDFHSFGFL